MSIPSTIKGIQDIMRKDVGLDGDAQRMSQLGWMLFLKIFDARETERELLDPNYRSPIPQRLRWRTWAANDEGLTGDDLLAFLDDELFPTLRELSLSGRVGDPTLVIRGVFEDAFNYMKSGTLVRQVINKLDDIDFNSSRDRHAFGDIYEQLLQGLQSAGNAGEYYTPRAVTRFMVDMVDPKLGERIIDPACGTGGFLTCAIDHLRTRFVETAEQEEVIQRSILGIEKKPLPHLLCTTNMMLHGIDVPTNIRRDNPLARPLRDWGLSERVDVVLTNPPFRGIEEDGIENNFPAASRTRETADLFLTLVLHILKPGGRAAIILPDSSLFGEGVKEVLRRRLLDECDLHTIVRLPHGVFSPYTDIRTNLLFFTKADKTKRIWYYELKSPTGEKYTKTKFIRTADFEPLRDWWGARVEEGYAWFIDSQHLPQNANLDIHNPRSPDIADALRVALTRRKDSLSGLETVQEEVIEAASLIEGRDPPKIYELLQTLSEVAPHVSLTSGIAEDLRTALTELALQGVLSSPSDTDESIDETLARYKASTRASTPSRVAVPFEIPSAWKWTTLGSIAEFEIGRTPSTKQAKYWVDGPETGAVPWVAISDMPRRGVVSTTTKMVSRVAAQEVFKKEPYAENTLLMAFKLSLGKTAILGCRAYHNEAIASLKIADPTLRHYLLWALPALAVHASSNPAIRGSTLNSKSIAALWIPIPPREEQERLVRALESINSLIDRLAKASEDLRETSDIVLKLIAQERALTFNDETAADAKELETPLLTLAGA